MELLQYLQTTEDGARERTPLAMCSLFALSMGTPDRLWLHIKHQRKLIPLARLHLRRRLPKRQGVLEQTEVSAALYRLARL
jgi:hypothetical protein